MYVCTYEVKSTILLAAICICVMYKSQGSGKNETERQPHRDDVSDAVQGAGHCDLLSEKKNPSGFEVYQSKS
jgi:hypothetical protein